MDEILKYIGSMIRERRLFKDLSTQELAGLINVSPSLINNIENAKTDTFNLEFMYTICKVLNIPIVNIILNKHIDVNDDAPDLLDIDYSEDIPPLNFSESIDTVKQNIDKIIKTYLSALSDLNYDSEKINRLTSKLLYEMDYTKSINLK